MIELDMCFTEQGLAFSLHCESIVCNAIPENSRGGSPDMDYHGMRLGDLTIRLPLFLDCRNFCVLTR